MHYKRNLTLLFVILTGLVFGQDSRSLPDTDLAPFYHGVASGDPLEDRVIIWTKVSPDEPLDEIEVQWRMALDTAMTEVVANGSFVTDANRDYTVKVDVEALDPNTFYYYDFNALGAFSLRGRTKTLPAETDQIRLAVMSCSNYEYGYFNAYKYLAERNDIDLVLHLGDYIYEYETGGYSAFIDGRNHEPEEETISLDDYRTRYSHYRLDPDLRAAHQQYPWVTVWDDHESANDAWKDGAQNHDDSEGPWGERLANSKQAYYEWLPVRGNPDQPLFRSFDLGGLVKLAMLDTRIHGRDEQVGATSPEISSPDRTLLGEDQKTWLDEEISGSDATWNVLGQQVMVAPLEILGNPLNPDQWDGYLADRNWLYDLLQTEAPGQAVVLTGDIHTAWANEIPLANYDHSAQTGSAGVEFVVSSVTSPGIDGIPAGLVTQTNPHVQWVNLEEHGFCVIEFTPDKVQGDWIFVNELNAQGGGFSVGASYESANGTPFFAESAVPLADFTFDKPLAPACPISNSVAVHEVPRDLMVTSVWPNPFTEAVQVQFGLNRASEVEVTLFDLNGRVVHQEQLGVFNRGLQYLELRFADLVSGTYILQLVAGETRVSRRIIRR